MRWALVKRFGVIVGILAAIIAAIVGLTTMWDWFREPVENLSAEVEFFPFIPPPGETSTSIRGVWKILVRNKGRLEASSVSLKLPNAVFAKIEREGTEPEIKNSLKEVIDLGNLRPEENISVISWTDITLTKSDAEKVRLNHKTGIGSVAITAPLGPAWQWLAKYWILLVGGLFIASVGLGLREGNPKVNANSKPT